MIFKTKGGLVRFMQVKYYTGIKHICRIFVDITFYIINEKCKMQKKSRMIPFFLILRVELTVFTVSYVTSPLPRPPAF